MLFAKFLEPLGTFELWQQVVLLLTVKTPEAETVAILVVDFPVSPFRKANVLFSLEDGITDVAQETVS